MAGTVQACVVAIDRTFQNQRFRHGRRNPKKKETVTVFERESGRLKKFKGKRFKKEKVYLKTLEACSL
jgi:hypothetical protein